LVWGAGLAITGFCLLITWGGANNARGALASPRIPDVCARAVTAQCQQVVAHAHAAARAAAAATSLLAQPGEIGHVAAGMLASVPGLLLIALVAGGHWGGEWGSSTIRQLLDRPGAACHDGDHSGLDAARAPGCRHCEHRAAVPGVVRAGLDEL